MCNSWQIIVCKNINKQYQKAGGSLGVSERVKVKFKLIHRILTASNEQMAQVIADKILLCCFIYWLLVFWDTLFRLCVRKSNILTIIFLSSYIIFLIVLILCRSELHKDQIISGSRSMFDGKIRRNVIIVSVVSQCSWSSRWRCCHLSSTQISSFRLFICVTTWSQYFYLYTYR